MATTRSQKMRLGLVTFPSEIFRVSFVCLFVCGHPRGQKRKGLCIGDGFNYFFIFTSQISEDDPI